MAKELTRDDYHNECMELSTKVSRLLGVAFKEVAYSGGVPGYTTGNIDKTRYNEIKEKLTKEFGEPEIVAPWHREHTHGIPPLKWRRTPQVESMRVSHLQLIHMMQRSDKQYCIVSFM